MGIVEARVKDFIDEDHFIFGMANLENLLEGPYANYKYGIVIGKKLDDEIIDAICNGPTPDYYRLYHNTNSELSRLAHRIKTDLLSLNIPVKVIEPTISEDKRNQHYFKTLSVGFSHKMVATRAGLGWIGKTGLFISFRFGPRLRLVSLITGYPLDYCKTPVNESRCGDCNICVEKCPADAATGELWNIKLQRDDILNVFRCREKCKEFSLSAGSPLCGICVSVCPRGKKFRDV